MRCICVRDKFRRCKAGEASCKGAGPGHRAKLHMVCPACEVRFACALDPLGNQALILP